VCLTQTVRYDGLPPGGVAERVRRRVASDLDADVVRVDPPDRAEPGADRDDGAARRPIATYRAVTTGRLPITYEWTVVADLDRESVFVREDAREPRYWPSGVAITGVCAGIVVGSIDLSVVVDPVLVFPLSLVGLFGLVVGLCLEFTPPTLGRTVLSAADDKARVEREATGLFVPMVALTALVGLAAVGLSSGNRAVIPLVVAGLYATAIGRLVVGDRLVTPVAPDPGGYLPAPAGEYLVTLVAAAAVPGLLLPIVRDTPSAARPVALVCAGTLAVLSFVAVVSTPWQQLRTIRSEWAAGSRAADTPRARVGTGVLTVATAYGSVAVGATLWAGGAGAGVAVLGSLAVGVLVRGVCFSLYAVLGVGMVAGALASVRRHRRRFREADPAAFPAADAVDVPVRVTDGGVLDAVAYDDGSRRRVFVSRAAVDLLGPDDDRLRAVLAHEAAHVHEGDARLAVWAPVLAPPLGLGANVLRATLDYRTREFRADRRAAEATSPEAMAGALDALASAAAERRRAATLDALTPFLPRGTVDGREDADPAGDDSAGRVTRRADGRARPIRRRVTAWWRQSPPWTGRWWARLVGPDGAFALFFGGFAVSRAHPTVEERTARLADGREETDE
jgi:Zn-dependent protease with chaperone function